MFGGSHDLRIGVEELLRSMVSMLFVVSSEVVIQFNLSQLGGRCTSSIDRWASSTRGLSCLYEVYLSLDQN